MDACSCGLLPCICVMGGDDDMMDIDVDAHAHLPTAATAKPPQPSRLRSLVAANATKQCMSCMFLPCICPAEEDESYGDDETTSIEAASPLDHHGHGGSCSTSDDDHAAMDEQDAAGRVRLPFPQPNRPAPKVETAPNTETETEPETEHQDIWIARELKRHMRPHQIAGVRFMYENAMANQGCILADYMGLGKTMQVIAVIYSFLTDRLLAASASASTATKEKKTGAVTPPPPPPTTILVLCPAICIPNWQNEFKKWLSPESLARCPVLAFDATAGKGTTSARQRVLQKWKKDGGVLLMGYEMYRSLLNPTMSVSSLDKDPTSHLQVCTRVSTSTMEITNSASTKIQKSAREFFKLLCDPGADLVVLDEGHRLKDPLSLLCQSVAKIQSKRRVVLTGYPVQNSLSEYWCMVNFARNGFLGSYDEFRAKYERPIVDGDLSKSKELIHLLKKVVLRRGKKLLKKQLPPKNEWILYCKLSKLQLQLYNSFLDYYGDATSADLLTAYSALLQVMNHPDIIYHKLSPDENDDINDENDLDGGSSPIVDLDAGWGWESEEKVLEKRQLALEQTRKRRQKVLDRQKSYEWARQTIFGSESSPRADTGSDGGSRRRKLPRSSPALAPGPAPVPPLQEEEYKTMVLENSGKMAVLMEIIQESFALGDKVVVFSQSVPTLKVITDFLRASSFNPQLAVDGDGQKTNTNTKTKAVAGGRRKAAALPSRRDPAGILRKKTTTTTTSRTTTTSSYEADSKIQGQWFLQIDGSTTGAKRMEYIQAFSSSGSTVQLLLVSTRAGAEGINLHAGNRLVLFDVSWNPSNDHQSMCRSHRIGQSKDVHVYRLVSTGTMERMIYEQQMKKVDLSTNVVDDLQATTPAASGGGSGQVKATDSTVTSSGFLKPPSQSTKPLVVDKSLMKGDEVLLKCVDKLSHWLVDVIPAHEHGEEEDNEEAEESDD